MTFQLLYRLVLTALVVATPILAQAAERGVALTIGNGADAAVTLAEASSDAPARKFSTSHARLDLYPFDGEWEGELRTTISSAPVRNEVSVDDVRDAGRRHWQRRARGRTFHSVRQDKR
jgi:hypothetical protein